MTGGLATRRGARLALHSAAASPRGQHAAALAAYAALSVLYFAAPILDELSSSCVCAGADPTLFMWSLEWWPHAVVNGLNPFLTEVVWAPSGYNLAWAASAPGASLLALPITLAAGPVAAYNVLIVLAPALAAWGAYVLCRLITGRFWPSLAGGYVFGFSSYMLGHTLGHLHMTLVFPIPLLAYLAIRHTTGRLSSRALLALATAALVLQFLFSTELFLTLTAFGAAAFALALLLHPPEARRPVWGTLKVVAGAYLASAVLLAPYLYYAFLHPSDTPTFNDPYRFSTDLLNLFVPTELTRLGRSTFAPVAATFTGNPAENGAYVGLPLIAAAVFFALWRLRGPWGRVLLACLLLAVVASFGPRLHIAGIGTVVMPYRAVVDLPLARHLLPGRLMLYAFLALAIMLAVVLAAQRGRALWRMVLGILCVVFLVPNAASALWRDELSVPAFFRGDLHRQHVRAGENLLVMPYGHRGPSMLWQAEADMRFRMAGGHLGVFPPPEFKGYPIVDAFYSGKLPPDAPRELRRFLADKGVTAIVAQEGVPRQWLDLFSSLEARRVRVGGVVVFRLAGGHRSAIVAPARPAPPTQLEPLRPPGRVTAELVGRETLPARPGSRRRPSSSASNTPNDDPCAAS